MCQTVKRLTNTQISPFLAQHHPFIDKIKLKIKLDKNLQVINCFDFAYFCFFCLNNLNFYKKYQK